MMIKLALTLTFLAGGICAVLSLTSRAVKAVGPAEVTYALNCRVIHLSADGTEKVLRVPELTQVDGQETSWFRGQEATVSMGSVDFIIPIAEQVRVRVHGVEDGRLRVFVTLSRSLVEDHVATPAHPSDLVVHESAVRKVQTVKPGELMTVWLDKRMKLELVVTLCGARV